MYSWSNLRRRSLLILLFSLCLSAVVLAKPVNSTPPEVFLSQRPANPPSVTSTERKTFELTQNVRKTVLDNGLTVLTKEVHTAPVVTVQVWYKIGSRNEAPGVNGIAHQLEHMLFKGTKDRPIQFGRLFSALGSASNAFTSYDQTAYFGTVEREKLKALLVLEADRMQNSVIDPQQLTSEKRVVISELQGYENSPNYRLSRAVMRAAFPNHPYGLTVGGTKADVEKFTVEQVQYYYRKYYSPDNATLIIVGDFQTEPTLAAVKEIFGKVPKQEAGSRRQEAGGVGAGLVNNSNNPSITPIQNPPVQESGGVGAGLVNNSNNPSITPVQNPPVQESGDSSTPRPQPSKPIVLREEGSASFMQEVYPLPTANHPDVPALDLMDYVLTGGRNSRLYQALVESGIASDLSGGAVNLLGGGWYELSATAAPGQTLEKIQQVLASELAQLRDKGVTDEELKRAKTQLTAKVILGNRDITSQAMQLGYDELSAGDYRYTDRYLAAVQKVGAADVQRVAQTYLKPDRRTVGFFEPTKLDDKADGDSTGAAKTSENFSAGPPVDPAEVAKYLPPVDSSATPTTQALPEQIRLDNGMRVLLFPDRSTPTVTLSGYIRAGTEFDTQAKAGLATLTADNVMNGTKTRDALEIAKALEERGASLGFGANREGANIQGDSLAADLPILLQTFADVVQNATFPPDKLELTRQQELTALKVKLDTPSQVAIRTFQQTVYPENHPFHAFPTEESLKAITREDVVEFYQKHYRPDTTILSLVGDFDISQVRSFLETQLALWQDNGNSPVANYPQVPLPKTRVALNPVLPGKTQAITLLGNRAIDRKDPRYYAALVLNQIVGGDTLSSRLGTEIRDRQGLTYGIYSYFQAGQHPGPFLIQMQTAPEDAQNAIASTIGLLDQIREKGVTSSEVAAAKRSLTSEYPVGLADPNDLAQTILSNEIYGLGRSELRDFVSKIEAVTVDQVNQAAKELLHPEKLVVVTAGPSVSASTK